MKRLRVVVLAFVILTANAVLAADGDERFQGGINDGSAQSAVLDAPITIPTGTVVKIH